jgi:glycosyltransferase involved in cell wall biosynthesis
VGFQFVAMTDTLGGGELYLLEVAVALSERHAVSLVSGPGSPLLDAARQRGVRAVELDLGRKLGRRSARGNLARFLSVQRRLGQLLRQAEPDDWVGFQYKWEELLWGGNTVPCRILLFEHGAIPERLIRTPYASRRLRSAFRRADRVVAWSQPAADSIFAFAGLRPLRLEAGMDRARAANAAATRDVTRTSLGLASTQPLIVYAGRLAPDKGIDILLHAIRMLDGALAVIAGDGPARSDLEKLAGTLQLGDRVRFAGFIGEPLPLLAAADATVLLSSSPGEGRPLSVVEAAAVGTSVIGSIDSPALRAMKDEGLVSHLVAREPEELARALRHTLATPRAATLPPSWSQVAGQLDKMLQT